MRTIFVLPLPNHIAYYALKMLSSYIPEK